MKNEELSRHFVKTSMQVDNEHPGTDSLIPIDVVKKGTLPVDIFDTKHIQALLGIAEERIQTLQKLSSAIHQGLDDSAVELIDQLLGIDGLEETNHGA